MKHIIFLLALLWLCNAQAQAIAFPQVPTGYFYNLAVPLAYRGSTPPKALIFTFFIRQSHFIRRSHSEGGSGGGKTQHRRRWPQPSPLASRCGFLPSPFLERACPDVVGLVRLRQAYGDQGGEAPKSFTSNHFYNEREKYFPLAPAALAGHKPLGLQQGGADQARPAP